MKYFLIGSLIGVVFLVVGGCTVATHDSPQARYRLAALGGQVAQVGDNYAVTSDQRQSLRDAVAGIVSYTITKAYEAIQLAEIGETEKTARGAIKAGVQSEEIQADVTKSLAEEETKRLLAE